MNTAATVHGVGRAARYRRHEPDRKGEPVRKWRKMTWTLIAANVLMAAWTIGAAAQGATDDVECGPGLTQAECDTVADVGSSIGVGLLVALWFVVFVVLALVWFMTRPRGER